MLLSIVLSRLTKRARFYSIYGEPRWLFTEILDFLKLIQSRSVFFARLDHTGFCLKARNGGVSFIPMIFMFRRVLRIYTYSNWETGLNRYTPYVSSRIKQIYGVFELAWIIRDTCPVMRTHL